MSIDTGGPAFPSHGSMGEVAHEGLSLRDYFAAKAMQAYFSDRYVTNWATHAPVAATASYILADAMLAEREQK